MEQVAKHPPVQLELRVDHYANGNIAVVAVHAGGPDRNPWGSARDRWGVLTVNDPSRALRADEILVKTWSENEDWYLDVKTQYAEFFEDTGETHQMGFGFAEVWRVIPFTDWEKEGHYGDEEEDQEEDSQEGRPQEGAREEEGARKEEGRPQEGVRCQSYPDHEGAFRFE
jgi:hypothetical protein